MTDQPILRLTPQQAGAQLESAVEWVNAHYVAADLLGDWWREGTRAIKASGEWVPQDSRPDFAGILPGGRFFTFDVKSCHESVYRHDVKTRGHQLIALWNAHMSDAVAGLLVCNVEAGRGYWIMPTGEWQVGQFVPRRLEFAREIPAHPDFEGGYVPNWLEAVR